eukprot:763266-Hanusia_phi.AAC.3
MLYDNFCVKCRQTNGDLIQCIILGCFRSKNGGMARGWRGESGCAVGKTTGIEADTLFLTLLVPQKLISSAGLEEQYRTVALNTAARFVHAMRLDLAKGQQKWERDQERNQRRSERNQRKGDVLGPGGSWSNKLLAVKQESAAVTNQTPPDIIDLTAESDVCCTKLQTDVDVIQQHHDSLVDDEETSFNSLGDEEIDDLDPQPPLKHHPNIVKEEDSEVEELV